MAQKPFLAKSGIITGSLTVNNTVMTHGSDVVISITDIQVANSIANTVLTRTSVAVSNSLALLTLVPNQLAVGNTTVNAIVNGTTIILGGAFVANSLGNYVTGLVNAASYKVGTTFTANATLVNAAAINIVGAANAATLYVTTSANLSGVAVASNNVTGNNITANNITTTYLNTVAVTGYQTTAGLSDNVAILTANNSLYLGGTIASGYQTTAGLSANVAVLTANNTLFLGGVAAAGYQTTAGLSANVAVLTANNSLYLGGTLAASYQTIAGLAANVATLGYQTSAGMSANVAVLTSNNSLYLGGTIASGYQTTAGLSANVATLTANNSTNLGGVAAASYAKLAGNQNLTGGFTVTANNLGVLTNFTVDYTKGQYQYGVANSAFTITAPTSDGGCDIYVLNGTAASTITLSGFTVGSGTGDTYATTSTSKFILSIRRINSISTYVWKALQ